MFGSGTAAIVSPIGGIHYEGEMRRIPVPEDSLAQRLAALKHHETHITCMIFYAPI